MNTVQELKMAWKDAIIEYDQIIAECYDNYKENDSYTKNNELLDSYALRRKEAWQAYSIAKKNKV
jgi:hypothetical protein